MFTTRLRALAPSALAAAAGASAAVAVQGGSRVHALEASHPVDALWQTVDS